MTPRKPQPGNFRHGCRYSYKIRKCGCDDCKAWNAADMQRYWNRHPDKKKARPNGWQAYNTAHNYINA